LLEGAIAAAPSPPPSVNGMLLAGSGDGETTTGVDRVWYLQLSWPKGPPAPAPAPASSVKRFATTVPQSRKGLPNLYYH
jgi:hypothetical protein